MKTVFLKKVFIGLAFATFATSASLHSMNEAMQRRLEIKLNPKLTCSYELEPFFKNSSEIHDLCKSTQIYLKFNSLYSGTSFDFPTSDGLAMAYILDNYHQEDQSQELLTNTLHEKYSPLIKEWTNTQLNGDTPRDDFKNCFFDVLYPSETNDFSIAHELLMIAGTNNLKEIAPQRGFEPEDELIVSKDTTPLLFDVITNLTQAYSITFPIIVVIKWQLETSCLPEPARITLGLHSIKYLTNDEIEFDIAHELAHLLFKHHNLSRQIQRHYSLISIDNYYRSTLRRIQEREADSAALLITKKPTAAITGFAKCMKIAIVTFGEGLELKGLNHPTIIERICFALSQLNTINNG